MIMFQWPSVQKLALLVAVPVTGLLLYMLLKRGEEDEDTLEQEQIVTSRQTVIEVKVPREAVAAVIGRQGAQIKEVQEKSGTRINFKDDVGPTENAERIAIVRGSPENAQLAELMIRKLIAAQPVQLVEEMYVPQKAVGRIIGRRGETVRGISRTSKAKIDVERESSRDQSEVRLITIKGSLEQIKYAKSLIQEKISEEDRFQAQLAVNASHRTQQRGHEHQAQGQKMDRQNQVLPSRRPPGSDKSLEWCAPSLPYTVTEWPDHHHYLEVYVSAVENPGHFWVQMISSQSTQLDRLIQDMTAYYRDEEYLQTSTCMSVQLGDLVAAPFEHDNNWYRARVVQQMDGGLYDVYFVDFGDSIYVAVEKLRKLRADFLQLPFQAVECSLASVEPAQDDSGQTRWSDQAVDAFETLTYCAQWKVLNARATELLPTDTGTSIPSLELVDTNSEQDIDIGEELIKRGFAVRTGRVAGRKARDPLHRKQVTDFQILSKDCLIDYTERSTDRPAEGTMPNMDRRARVLSMKRKFRKHFPKKAGGKEGFSASLHDDFDEDAGALSQQIFDKGTGQSRVFCVEMVPFVKELCVQTPSVNIDSGVGNTALVDNPLVDRKFSDSSKDPSQYEKSPGGDDYLIPCFEDGNNILQTSPEVSMTDSRECMCHSCEKIDCEELIDITEQQPESLSGLDAPFLPMSLVSSRQPLSVSADHDTVVGTTDEVPSCEELHEFECDTKMFRLASQPDVTGQWSDYAVCFNGPQLLLDCNDNIEKLIEVPTVNDHQEEEEVRDFMISELCEKLTSFHLETENYSTSGAHSNDVQLVKSNSDGSGFNGIESPIDACDQIHTGVNLDKNRSIRLFHVVSEPGIQESSGDSIQDWSCMNMPIHIASVEETDLNQECIAVVLPCLRDTAVVATENIRSIGDQSQSSLTALPQMEPPAPQCTTFAETLPSDCTTWRMSPSSEVPIVLELKDVKASAFNSEDEDEGNYGSGLSECDSLEASVDSLTLPSSISRNERKPNLDRVLSDIHEETWDPHDIDSWLRETECSMKQEPVIVQPFSGFGDTAKDGYFLHEEPVEEQALKKSDPQHMKTHMEEVKLSDSFYLHDSTSPMKSPASPVSHRAPATNHSFKEAEPWATRTAQKPTSLPLQNPATEQSPSFHRPDSGIYTNSPVGDSPMWIPPSFFHVATDGGSDYGNHLVCTSSPRLSSSIMPNAQNEPFQRNATSEIPGLLPVSPKESNAPKDSNVTNNTMSQLMQHSIYVCPDRRGMDSPGGQSQRQVIYSSSSGQSQDNNQDNGGDVTNSLNLSCLSAPRVESSDQMSMSYDSLDSDCVFTQLPEQENPPQLLMSPIVEDHRDLMSRNSVDFMAKSVLSEDSLSEKSYYSDDSIEGCYDLDGPELDTKVDLHSPGSKVPAYPVESSPGKEWDIPQCGGIVEPSLLLTESEVPSDTKAVMTRSQEKEITREQSPKPCVAAAVSCDTDPSARSLVHSLGTDSLATSGPGCPVMEGGNDTDLALSSFFEGTDLSGYPSMHEVLSITTTISSSTPYLPQCIDSCHRSSEFLVCPSSHTSQCGDNSQSWSPFCFKAGDRKYKVSESDEGVIKAGPEQVSEAGDCCSSTLNIE
ncbi:uncharacterized protein LOC106180249 [Lingula anatina]|uniref:Uncharacterized protein LOC106180249 n=1 Tax=Lingula anatina TaxID=7574 RepID=A0A1S3KBL4_LINAN|nr:uncharacterized protein LOC106180249 [Lingula anatina]|eukprot:XP_013419646.1 uncharacterized protein LOC106180249 [Lingula anatina]